MRRISKPKFQGVGMYIFAATGGRALQSKTKVKEIRLNKQNAGEQDPEGMSVH